MSAPTSANPHIKEPHTETSRRRWGSAVTGAATAGTPAASVMRTPGRWDRAPARSRERRGDRRRAPVEPVHGGLQAVARHGDHRRRRVRHGVLGRRPFLGRESREHVLRRVDAAWRPADANTHAWKRAGAQVIDDGTDPIVPAGAVPGAEPEGPERKVEVVIDDDQVGRTPAAPAEEIPHRDAALVHIGLRDGQPRGRLTQPRTPRTGPSVVAQPHPEFGRVPRYRGPGFPRPTMRITAQTRRARTRPPARGTASTRTQDSGRDYSFFSLLSGFAGLASAVGTASPSAGAGRPTSSGCASPSPAAAAAGASASSTGATTAASTRSGGVTTSMPSATRMSRA